MPVYHYSLNWPVLDASSKLVLNRNDGVMVDRNGAEVETTNELGVPIRVSTGPIGTTKNFLAPVPFGRVRFGADAEAPVWADEQQDALEKAEEAAAYAARIAEHLEVLSRDATEITYIYRSPDGGIYASPTPVIENGGSVTVTDNGDVFVNFEAP